MNLSFITSLFKQKTKTLCVPDSILVKKLKSLSFHSNLLIYSNVKIYHHAKTYEIPLIMLDNLRGLYIFEIKGWSYDDLKNSNIQKAKNQDASKDTLSFDNKQEIIRKKFNELTHNDGVPIFNYLIMENLSADEYEHLDESLKKLLPFDKLIFNDYQDSDIFKILQKASEEKSSLPSTDEILGTLFVQYTILDEDSRLNLCSNEQIEFIDKPLEAVQILNGVPNSGKSSLLLLKSIVELFNNPSKKIIIIKPTILACDTLKKKLLEIVEHAIIEIDLTLIEIVTPQELINRHLQKLNKPLVKEKTLYIDEKLMHKSFQIADIIMCDDAGMYANNFIHYLRHIQKKSKLLLVNEKDSTVSKILNTNFRVNQPKLDFIQTNPHAKALHLIQSILLDSKDENILVVSNSLSREKLKDDLEFFILQDPELLDSSKHLMYQEFSRLILATYADINTISAKHIIILDLCFTNAYEIEYALNLASLSVSILYEEDCQEILDLRGKYESTQE